MSNIHRATILCMCAVFSVGLCAQESEIARLIAAVKDGPSLYRTSEAASYFVTRKPDDATPYSEDASTALRALRSAILLGEKGVDAKEAIPDLIDKFTTAVHVALIRDARYTRGNGSLDDWASTLALSERTKFMVNNALLEHATMSKCDDFIVVTTDKVVKEKRGSGANIVDATADIYVIITLNAAACALTQLTGENVGTTQDAWREWWARLGSSFTPAAQPARNSKAPEQAPISSGGSLDDIVVKGKYRIALSSGDELVGIIESITDDGLVLETDNGEPFSFQKRMIVQHALLELPKKLQSISAGATQAEVYSWDELRRTPPTGKKLEIRIASGAAFVGRLVFVDGQSLRLDVDGSEIPFGKDAVTQISSVVDAPPPVVAPAPIVTAPEPGDTLIIKNPQTDEYGRALKELVLVGTIVSDQGGVVSFKTRDGQIRKVAYADIVRRISNSVKPGFDAIERYGKPIFCPTGMILVDVPPGKRDRPFFKVCIDKYEFPNKQGAVPTGNITYQAAQKQCESQGKRLCTSQEWQYACAGLENYPYPYGSDYKEENCNGEGNKLLEPSGNRMKCISKFGVYDMMGNIFEWVTGAEGQPMLMGGPLSKCQTVSPGVGGQAKPVTGYRCCKSN